MDDDSNWCLHTNKKNAISRTFVIFQFNEGVHYLKKFGTIYIRSAFEILFCKTLNFIFQEIIHMYRA